MTNDLCSVLIVTSTKEVTSGGQRWPAVASVNVLADNVFKNNVDNGTVVDDCLGN